MYNILLFRYELKNKHLYFAYKDLKDLDTCFLPPYLFLFLFFLHEG